MSAEPQVWRNRSPGDLSVELGEIAADNGEASVARSLKAFPSWSRLGWEDRMALLRGGQARLREKQEELARLIALEVGKPLREARGEMEAVVAKFDLTFRDAERYFSDESVADGPYPAMIRHRPRGPAAVIAPFNFPIHLGHGAAVAYLLAGNTVLFKPSPLAANASAAYAAEMRAALPEGVFELVQGWGEAGRKLCLHPAVRSVCFTGSVSVGAALARDLAGDYSKSLALELGGKNTLFVCADADLDAAAAAAADGMCLTTGQRCNATSRILLHADVREAFLNKFLKSLERYVPGNPLEQTTLLGPLVNEAAIARYRSLTSRPGEWLLPGIVVDDRNGYFVRPAVFLGAPWEGEAFAPIVSVETFSSVEEAVSRHEEIPYGLVASIFTASRNTFETLGTLLSVGNLYHNLPTTFSPSTLPFGGLGLSGNGKPGGRGFIRFAADDQAVQWK